MPLLTKILTGGFLAGYRTYILGFGLAAQGLGSWLAGDITLVQFAGQLPEILGGLGFMSLRAGVSKYLPALQALDAAVKSSKK